MQLVTKAGGPDVFDATRPSSCREMPTDVERKFCGHQSDSCRSTLPHLKSTSCRKGSQNLPEGSGMTSGLQRSEAPPCWLLFVLQLLPTFFMAASPACVRLFSLPGCGVEPSRALEVFLFYLFIYCPLFNQGNSH
ncbi:unnamed protein product [Arctogadus glacialis]